VIPVLPTTATATVEPTPIDGTDRIVTKFADEPVVTPGGEPAGGEGPFAAYDDLAADPKTAETSAAPAVNPVAADPMRVSSPEINGDGPVVGLKALADVGMAELAPAEPEAVVVTDSSSRATQRTNSPLEDIYDAAAAAVTEPLAAELPLDAPLIVLGPSLLAPVSDALSEPLVPEPVDDPATDPDPAAGGETEAILGGVELDRLAGELQALGLPVARSEATLRIDLLDLVRFRVDVSAIPEEALGGLRELGRVLAGHPGIRVRVIGHTDRTGPPDYNRALSEQRAVAVVDQLVAAGLDPSRVIAEGRGMDEPIQNVDGLPVHVRRIEVLVDTLRDVSEPRAAQNGDGAP
jgi:outer membrane protein OmpA-like peptidoglycan-associated protein